MDQEIKDVIAKHLPQQVGAALQERLKKGDADAERVTQLLANQKTAEGDYNRLKASFEHSQAALAAHGVLADREKAVDARERACEIFELKTQLSAASGNAQFCKDVALGLVRNIDFRKTVFEAGQETLMQPNPGGFATLMQGQPRNSSSTIEEKAS